MKHPKEVNAVVQRVKGRTIQFWSWFHGWMKDADNRWARPIGLTTYEETWCEPENDSKTARS